MPEFGRNGREALFPGWEVLWSGMSCCRWGLSGDFPHPALQWEHASRTRNAGSGSHSRCRWLAFPRLSRGCTASPARCPSPPRHRACSRPGGTEPPFGSAPSLTHVMLRNSPPLHAGFIGDATPAGFRFLRHPSTPEAPSLGGYYPASPVLRASPPPVGPACPSRGPGCRVHGHRQGFPCCYACRPSVPRSRPDDHRSTEMLDRGRGPGAPTVADSRPSGYGVGPTGPETNRPDPARPPPPPRAVGHDKMREHIELGTCGTSGRFAGTRTPTPRTVRGGENHRREAAVDLSIRTTSLGGWTRSHQPAATPPLGVWGGIAQ